MLASAEEAIEYNEGTAEMHEKAEYYLLHYEEEFNRYINAKEEFMNYKEECDENIGGGRSGVGKPTECMALKELEFNEKYDGLIWLKAVEIVQRGLGERKNIFIRVRKEAERNKMYSAGKGRKGWVIYVQMRFAQEMSSRFILPDFSVSEITVKRWWGEIIKRTVDIANEIFKKYHTF